MVNVKHAITQQQQNTRGIILNHERIIECFLVIHIMFDIYEPQEKHFYVKIKHIGLRL